MNALRTTFSDIKLKQNNKRALTIHFCLTLIGLPLAFFVGSFANNHNLGFLAFDSATGIVPFVVTLIIGPLAYIACGYVYLKPTKHKEGLSLLWLTYMLVGWSFLLCILAPVLWLAESSGLTGGYSPFWMLQMLYILYIPLTPLLNAIGFGLMYTFMGIIENLGLSTHIPGYEIATLIMLMLVSIVPSALLYIGFQIKMWRTRRGDLPYETNVRKSRNSAPLTTEEHDQDWSNSACENFNWENEAK